MGTTKSRRSQRKKGQKVATLFFLALCSAAASVVNSFFGVVSVGARSETEHSIKRVLVPQPSVEAGKAVLKWVRQGIHGPRSFDRRLHLHAGRCRLPGATRCPNLASAHTQLVRVRRFPTTRARHMFHALRHFHKSFAFFRGVGWSCSEGRAIALLSRP